jgi:hypothetical protein
MVAPAIACPTRQRNQPLRGAQARAVASAGRHRCIDTRLGRLDTGFIAFREGRPRARHLRLNLWLTNAMRPFAELSALQPHALAAARQSLDKLANEISKLEGGEVARAARQRFTSSIRHLANNQGVPCRAQQQFDNSGSRGNCAHRRNPNREPPKHMKEGWIDDEGERQVGAANTTWCSVPSARGRLVRTDPAGMLASVSQVSQNERRIEEASDHGPCDRRSRLRITTSFQDSGLAYGG